jgi:hypothetical protein
MWHPADGSALVLLAPWARVFSRPDWEGLLAGSIVPKLVAALAGWAVNPAGQVLAGSSSKGVGHSAVLHPNI